MCTLNYLSHNSYEFHFKDSYSYYYLVLFSFLCHLSLNIKKTFNNTWSRPWNTHPASANNCGDTLALSLVLIIHTNLQDILFTLFQPIIYLGFPYFLKHSKVVFQHSSIHLTNHFGQLNGSYARWKQKEIDWCPKVYLSDGWLVW